MSASEMSSHAASSAAAADVDALSESPLAEGARQIADRPDTRRALQGVVDLALTACVCDRASVTLIGADGSVETAASSDELVEQADQLQYSLDEGPCLTAAEEGGVYLIPDTATDARWPRWGPAVARLGLRSVLSIHLFTDHRVLGALNLYFEPRDEFSAEEVDVARVVAAHASVALARLRAEQDLWKAVDARHLVGQAQGMLMERFGLTPERAFSVLRRYSQQHNIKLREVATTLVTTGRLPTTGPGADPAADADGAPSTTGQSELGVRPQLDADGAEPA